MIRKYSMLVVFALFLASVPPIAAFATPTSAATPMNVPGGFRHLAFQDDFSGTKLDRSRWTTWYPWGRLRGCTNGNDEQEWYLPGQVTVGDDALHLTADVREVHHHSYISGMVTTWRRF